MWSGVNPDIWSDGIHQKPDTGRNGQKNEQKNAVFWRFFECFTMLPIRYELYTLQQVRRHYNTSFESRL